MYAKAIIPGDQVDVPILIATMATGSVVAEQLHARGWKTYGGAPAAGEGQVQIMPDRLVVIVEGEEILRDDTNPGSPPGWWEAVDRLGGMALLVLMPAGTPLGQPAIGEALEQLIGDKGTAQALLPVVHS